MNESGESDDDDDDVDDDDVDDDDVPWFSLTRKLCPGLLFQLLCN